MRRGDDTGASSVLWVEPGDRAVHESKHTFKLSNQNVEGEEVRTHPDPDRNFTISSSFPPVSAPSSSQSPALESLLREDESPLPSEVGPVESDVSVKWPESVVDKEAVDEGSGWKDMRRRERMSSG